MSKFFIEDSLKFAMLQYCNIMNFKESSITYLLFVMLDLYLKDFIISCYVFSILILGMFLPILG